MNPSDNRYMKKFNMRNPLFNLMTMSLAIGVPMNVVDHVFKDAGKNPEKYRKPDPDVEMRKNIQKDISEWNKQVDKKKEEKQLAKQKDKQK